MNSCCHAQSGSKVFSFFAPGYCRRLKKKGFEVSQKHLLEGLGRVGFEGTDLLEIGSGVGHLHQTLIERGANSAVGVDLSPKMLELAGRWAAERGLSERVEYLEGDAVELIAGGNIDRRFDVAVLDKVICCYPDYEALLGAALKVCDRAIAFTIPRNRWDVRLMVRFGNIPMWLLRSDFRSYVHDPEAIGRLLESAGFSVAYENTTLTWLTRVYSRA